MISIEIKKIIKHSMLGFVPCPRIIYHGKWRAETVALTFDDGPRLELTDKLLETLYNEKVKATFFLLGEAIQKYPELALSIYRAGHSIGSHGYGHLNARKETLKSLIQDLRTADKVFNDVLGFTPRYFRPPMGVLNVNILLAAILLNKHLVYWTWDLKDYWTKDLISSIDINKVESGDIILLHEYRPTIDALPSIINLLRKTRHNFGVIGNASPV